MFGDTFFNISENKEFIEVLKSDDKERFLPMLSAHADEITMYVVGSCAHFRARRCLLAMIQGDGCEPALELYARTAPHDPQIPTPLASVSYSFHEAYDIVQLLLNQGPVDHANIKCKVHPYDDFNACPLQRLLCRLSSVPFMRCSWDHCTSVIKLIILLCQWDTKSFLDCARLLAPHTNGLNDIAWSYVVDGNLVSLAALLLLAHEKVLLPFDSGLTIEQRIKNTVDFLGSSNLDQDGAAYQYMLTDACKLIDIFKRAGVGLGSYCSLMHEYVPPQKVLADVASMLKRAGYALEPRDIDLRDCYRAFPELKRASVFKLSSPQSPNYHYPSPSSHARPQGFGAAIQNYPYRGYCPLLNKVKSSPVLSFRPSASEPRLLSTVAVHVENGVSGILQKQMAYIAFRLKRGIKF